MVGDALYGIKKISNFIVDNKNLVDYLSSINRQMLHSYELEIVHPVLGRKMRFRADIPDDMLALDLKLNMSSGII